MSKRIGLFFITILVAAMVAYPVLARGNQSQNASSSGNSSSSSPPANTWNDNSQRNIDDRQLNAFAVELAQVDPKNSQARAQLDDLATRVEKYHQDLFTRNYNAMDILKDTEGLQKRIEARRAELPEPQKPAEKPTIKQP
jgi:hypothetical protein